MKSLRNIFVFILLCGIYLIIFHIEMNTIFQQLNIVYTVLLVLANVILFGVALLLLINKWLSTNSKTHRNINRQKDVSREPLNNPSTIIPKPLGGYSREQLNEIYLIGILIHQIYYSATENILSQEQQRKALSIQMRFFITVFPQRNVNEYFDYTETFMNKNGELYNYSVLEATERSMQLLSTCNSNQIRKLRTLYNTLCTIYIEIGGGNKDTLNTYIKMLDAELSNLTVEDNRRKHYAKKKAH